VPGSFTCLKWSLVPPDLLLVTRNVVYLTSLYSYPQVRKDDDTTNILEKLISIEEYLNVFLICYIVLEYIVYKFKN
jgi:hypothetical protein